MFSEYTIRVLGEESGEYVWSFFRIRGRREFLD